MQNMDMMQGSAQAPAAEGETTAEEGTSVTVTKRPDGTYEVDGQPCASMDEALMMTRKALMAGGMTVEEAFSDGFSGGDHSADMAY